MSEGGRPTGGMIAALLALSGNALGVLSGCGCLLLMAVPVWVIFGHFLRDLVSVLHGH